MNKQELISMVVGLFILVVIIGVGQLFGPQRNNGVTERFLEEQSTARDAEQRSEDTTNNKQQSSRPIYSILQPSTSSDNSSQSSVGNTPTGNAQSSNTVKEESPLHAYGNAVATALTTYTDVALEAEAVFALSKDVSDTEARTTLDVRLSEYSVLISALSTLATPAEATTYKQQFTTAYQAVHAALQNTLAKTTHEDVLGSFEAYGTAGQKVNSAIYNFAVFLKTKGIVFSASEPGRLFTLPSN